MTYFKDINTLEESRSQYKKLLKKYHPDQPEGSEEATKAINVEYEKLFKMLKDRHDTHSTNKTESNTSYKDMKYDFEEDELLREILQKVITFDGITIEICGSWIWLSGNTYQYRKDLKGIGFKWASQKKQWYWHSDSYIKKSRKTLSMDDIRNYYGSTEIRPESKLRIAEA